VGIVNFLKTAITGVDNQSTDIIRLFLFIVASVFIIAYVIGIVVFLRDYTFPIDKYTSSMRDFATSFLLLFTGAGAALFMKQSTEPKGQP
jgi:hypothetical protein